MRLAWASDLHLNFPLYEVRDRFYCAVRAQNPDLLVVTGDTAEAPSLRTYLDEMQVATGIPIAFVLGNHDYYGSSIAEMNEHVLTWKDQDRTWLTARGFVELTPDVALVGHEGWYDARAGKGEWTALQMADFRYIEELKEDDRLRRVFTMRDLAEISQIAIADKVREAFKYYRKVIVATHVPPFEKASLYNGKENSESIGFFVNTAMGWALESLAKQNPDREILVLAGHTHDPAHVQILPNLEVRVAGAEYYWPSVQNPIDLE